MTSHTTCSGFNAFKISFSFFKNIISRAPLLLMAFILQQTAFAQVDCKPSFEISAIGTFDNTVCDVSKHLFKHKYAFEWPCLESMPGRH